MDTKQIITNFLNDQKSFKDFFSSIGEYVDERLTSCKAVHDANLSLAEQNKDLFIECQRLEEKLKELETQAVKSPVFTAQNKVAEKTIEPHVETGIVQLDEYEINGDSEYTTTAFGEFFLVSARAIYDYLTFRASGDILQKYAKKENDATYRTYHYTVKGQLGIEELKKYNPNMEVFYRISHLNLTNHQKEKVILSSAETNEIFTLCFSNIRYIKHSLVLRLGLHFKVGTSSYKRFQRYKNKKPTVIENRTAIENRAEKENKTEKEIRTVSLTEKEHRTFNIILDRDYSIQDFSLVFSVNKKVLKTILKKYLGMKNNQCFPAGFVIPKSFVKEFVLKVIPLNEPFYPPVVFESDDNLVNFENYVNSKGRFLGGWFYVGHHEIKEFNLKFKKDEWSKTFEQTYNVFEKAGY